MEMLADGSLSQEEWDEWRLQHHSESGQIFREKMKYAGLAKRGSLVCFFAGIMLGVAAFVKSRPIHPLFCWSFIIFAIFAAFWIHSLLTVVF
jgi:hypothetical protein